MPVLVNFDLPTFWTPANAFGKAATVKGDYEGKPLTVSFYWAGMAEVGKSRTMQQRNEEVINFLKGYNPRHINATVLHFMHDGVDFRRILDPKWIPGW